jgi:hypothetical protein
MEKFYSVVFDVHNAEADSWSSKVQYTTKDLRDAKANFGSECSRLFGSADFDFVCVTLKDNFSNVISSEFVDERVAPEPPEPNAE